nr:MAG TPA: hypothetical protein [Caudoviricetes sp.]
MHFLQQLPGQLPAGGIGSGLEVADGTGLAGDVEPGAGLSFGRHVLIAGQRGADVATKQLHLIHRSFLPGLRCAVGAGQNAGRHPVNEGHFGFFTVSLLEIHFIFLLFLVIVSTYVPNSTMRQWKMKSEKFLSIGAEFFCAVFCFYHAIYFEGEGCV